MKLRKELVPINQLKVDLIGLPITATSATRRKDPIEDGKTKRLLITGAAGVVGQVTAALLSSEFEVSGLDLNSGDYVGFTNWKVGSVADRSFVFECVENADYVLHAATGAPNGWKGLTEVEIEGSRNILDAATHFNVKRVIITSSNHVTGWTEIDRLESRAAEISTPHSPIRPDGLYASAKMFAESLARAHAEHSGLSSSLIRIGAMRLNDNPESLANDPNFDYIGSAERILGRSRNVWLTHQDWIKILREEMLAKETFRVRYGSSNYEDTPWTNDVYSWTRAKF